MIKLFESTQYIKDKNKTLKKSNFSLALLEKQLNLFQSDVNYPSLKYKHINCKYANNRYSIRIDKNYRVLLNKFDDSTYELFRLVDHKEYDRLVKPQNC